MQSQPDLRLPRSLNEVRGRPSSKDKASRGGFLFVCRSTHPAIRQWSRVRQQNSDRLSQTLARVCNRHSHRPDGA